jgi:multidrug efflux pump
LQFELSAELGVVEQEVQSSLSTASSKLPNDLPTPPIYRKVNPADVPVITLAISSETLPLTTVYDMVDTELHKSFLSFQVSEWLALRVGNVQQYACK